MTARAASSPARHRGLAGRIRATLTGLADRAHASGDEQAQATGWVVTAVPGPFGLNGRTYRDPRFATTKRPAR